MAWENFDAEMRRRLGNDFDAGFKQSNGQTNLNYYQNNSDWKAVGNSLGLKINTLNDLNSAFDFVGSGKKKSKKTDSRSGGGAGGLQSSGSGATYSGQTAFDPGRAFVPGTPGREAVDAVEGVEGVEGVQEQFASSNKKMSTAARGANSWRGAGNFDGNPNNWGAKDLIGAYQAGYTEQDVENFLRQGNTFSPEGSAYRALREAKKKISTQFVGRQYHPDYTRDYAAGGPAYMFGDADLIGNRKAGWSDTEILEYLDNNLGTLNPNNAPGAAGGVYERLNARKFVQGIDPVQAIQAVDAIPAVEAIDPIEAIPARNLLIGNSNLGNAGYAQAVAPNRSEGSRSSRSSYGTSQFNRNNFGKKKRSPITTGLNI